ncbi:hypothetical protein RND81_01G030200 [Saponaria officinalis]|uniref:Uncharacterized protein n=1 Tax=Saponaria officinalis TaxID=3572 RepID=A0AAW1N5E6_SAPOF
MVIVALSLTLKPVALCYTCASRLCYTRRSSTIPSTFKLTMSQKPTPVTSHLFPITINTRVIAITPFAIVMTVLTNYTAPILPVISSFIPNLFISNTTKRSGFIVEVIIITEVTFLRWGVGVTPLKLLPFVTYSHTASLSLHLLNTPFNVNRPSINFLQCSKSFTSKPTLNLPAQLILKSSCLSTLCRHQFLSKTTKFYKFRIKLSHSHFISLLQISKLSHFFIFYMIGKELILKHLLKVIPILLIQHGYSLGISPSNRFHKIFFYRLPPSVSLFLKIIYGYSSLKLHGTPYSQENFIHLSHPIV